MCYCWCSFLFLKLILSLIDSLVFLWSGYFPFIVQYQLSHEPALAEIVNFTKPLFPMRHIMNWLLLLCNRTGNLNQMA